MLSKVNSVYLNKRIDIYLPITCHSKGHWKRFTFALIYHNNRTWRARDSFLWKHSLPRSHRTTVSQEEYVSMKKDNGHLNVCLTKKRTKKGRNHISQLITFLCKQQLRYAHALIGRNSSGKNIPCKHRRRTCTFDCVFKITRFKFAFFLPRF